MSYAILTTKVTKKAQSTQKKLCDLCEKLCDLCGLRKVIHGVTSVPVIKNGGHAALSPPYIVTDGKSLLREV